MYRREIAFLRRNFEHVMSRIDRIEQNQERIMRNQERIIRNQESQNLEMTAPIVAESHRKRKRSSTGSSEPLAKISKLSPERAIVLRHPNQQESLSCQDICDRYISSLSPEVRENAQQKIEKSFIDIIIDYATFRNQARKSISIMDLGEFLTPLPYFAEDGSPMMLSEGRIDEIKRAETTGTIFSILDCEFMSYLNCDPLMRVMPEHDYRQKLKDYIMSHEIFQLTGERPHSDLLSGSKLALVIDLGKTIRFSKVWNIRKVVAYFLQVNISSLIICDIHAN